VRVAEAFFLALIVIVTASYAAKMLVPPQPPLRCLRDANTVAAWITLHSSRSKDLQLLAVKANATLQPTPHHCVAPVVVWVNGTPRLYTVGWKP